MRSLATFLWCVGALPLLILGDVAADLALVREYVAAHANSTFRAPNGSLAFPYLVPAGPYDQLWDWDSVFMGVALFEHGSAPFLLGSMSNFLNLTNLTNGEVRGCLTPDGGTDTEYHAKPIVIQGAYLAAQYLQNFTAMRQFQPQMEALLNYWDRTRLQPNGLYVWFDQLESGCDDLVISTCPSHFSTECWNPEWHSLKIAAPDIMTFLNREHLAFSLFLQHWASSTQDLREAEQLQDLAARHRAKAAAIHAALDTFLWDASLGVYTALNVSASPPRVTNRVFLMGFPVFGGLANASQVAQIATALSQPDMLTDFGVRSVSNTDPRYSNANIIKPYSNWRGPIWVNANYALAVGLQALEPVLALRIAESVTATLANDIRNTTTWHECFSSDSGAGLAADGFLSWDTLGARMLPDLQAGINPFALQL